MLDRNANEHPSSRKKRSLCWNHLINIKQLQHLTQKYLIVYVHDVGHFAATSFPKYHTAGNSYGLICITFAVIWYSSPLVLCVRSQECSRFWFPHIPLISATGIKFVWLCSGSLQPSEGVRGWLLQTLLTMHFKVLKVLLRVFHPFYGGCSEQ